MPAWVAEWPLHAAIPAPATREPGPRWRGLPGVVNDRQRWFPSRCGFAAAGGSRRAAARPGQAAEAGPQAVERPDGFRRALRRFPARTPATASSGLPSARRSRSSSSRVAAASRACMAGQGRAGRSGARLPQDGAERARRGRDPLTALHNDQAGQRALADAVHSSADALGLACDHYEHGLFSFVGVLGGWQWTARRIGGE